MIAKVTNKTRYFPQRVFIGVIDKKKGYFYNFAVWEKNSIRNYKSSHNE